MNDDAKLLQRYARENSQEAFAELVRRHVDLVYSAAVRRCNGDTHRAEDAAQQVFVSLARSAEKLASHPALEAWLYAATRNAVINLALAEQRRAKREQEAAMSGLLSPDEPAPDWSELRPVLDAVMDELSETDRTAVLLRFFKKHSFSEIGASLNVSENTARMRTERALEKLRVLLGKRGVRSSTAVLGLALGRQAVVAAPAAVAAGVTACVLGLTKGSPAVGVSTAAGAGKGTLTAVLLAVAAVLVVVGVVRLREPRAGATAGNNAAGLGPGAPAAAGPDKVAESKLVEATASSSATVPVRVGKGEMTVASSVRQPVAPSDPKAVEILQKMAAAYQALSAYQDDGVVLIEHKSTGGLHARVAFRTYFLRPDRFRFDWDDPPSVTLKGKLTNQSRIWQNGDKSRSYFLDAAKIHEHNQYSAAIAGHFPVSYGSSFHVPLLFNPHAKLPWFSLSKLQGVELNGEEEQQSMPCYRMKGTHPNGTPYELWISKVDYLIRKIRSRTTFSILNSTKRRADEGSVVEEVHRNIRINGRISLATFEAIQSP